MELPECIAQCLAKNGAVETTPFGEDVLVYKVAGKMFALTLPSSFPARVNLKCNPDRAMELRDQYEAVLPGYHMNKKHWNTVILASDLSDEQIVDLIDHSYDLVVQGLSRSLRESIGA